TEASTRVIARSAGGYGLSPDLPPGRNFDLLGWKLNTPSDEDNNGKSDLISEVQLAKGATDERYFFTGPDGGMVFRCPIAGARTSKNTKFTRTELREMLRRGDTSISTKNEDKSPNKNNWVFSSAPEKAQKKAGGVDGVLRATLAVNHVTTTGDANQVGRVVIGQIHGAKDEPVRIYYRKLPGHQRGSIYIAHEPASRDDLWIDLIGSRADDAEDPADGFALDEKFSYVINATGNLLTVTILQDGKKRAEKSVDMSNSGYDVYNEYLYFKAGVYIQDSTGAPDDYAQATFYELEYEHGP
ncbi:MAG: polysaccharide lyase family 7 protein, partial [Myxococcota bacterium]